MAPPPELGKVPSIGSKSLSHIDCPGFSCDNGIFGFYCFLLGKFNLVGRLGLCCTRWNRLAWLGQVSGPPGLLNILLALKPKQPLLIVLRLVFFKLLTIENIDAAKVETVRQQ